jgi:hypothetical protein
MDMGLLRARDAGCREVLQRRKIQAMGMLSDKNGKCKGLFDGFGNSREPNPVQQNITGLPAGNFFVRLARPVGPGAGIWTPFFLFLGGP